MTQRWTQAEAERAVAMSKRGMSGAQIGRVLGRSRCSVIAKLNRVRANGIAPLQRKKMNAERDARIAELYKSSMTARQLGEKFNLKPSTIRGIVRREGATISKDEAARRTSIGLRKSNKRIGRPPVWPDCPPSLRTDYKRLRHNYGFRASEAKAALLEITA